MIINFINFPHYFLILFKNIIVLDNMINKFGLFFLSIILILISPMENLLYNKHIINLSMITLINLIFLHLIINNLIFFKCNLNINLFINLLFIWVISNLNIFLLNFCFLLLLLLIIFSFLTHFIAIFLIIFIIRKTNFSLLCCFFQFIIIIVLLLILILLLNLLIFKSTFNQNYKILLHYKFN